MTKGAPPQRPPRSLPRRTRSSAALAPASGGLQLVFTGGPRSGSELVVEGDEAVIGRASENEVSVPDTSVSRRHARLRKGDQGWTVNDLGSGNGTLVNGEPIEGEVLLRPGDVVTLGDTEFTVRFEAGEPTAGRGRRLSADLPAPRARPGTPRTSRGSNRIDPAVRARRMRLVRIIAIATCVLLALLVGLKIQLDRRERAEAERKARMERARAELGAKHQQAKNLFREHRWAEAKAKFQEIAKADPKYGSGTGYTVQNYLEHIERELEYQVHLNAAAAALDKNDLGGAAEALSKVDRSETQMLDDLEGLRQRLDEQITRRIAEGRELAEKGAKDLEQMRALLALSEDVLAAAPQNREAPALYAKAQERIQALTRQPVKVSSEPKPWLDAARSYEQGDVSEALSLARECAAKHPQCRALAAQIEEFQGGLKRAESAGTKELEQLLELDRRITGGPVSKPAEPVVLRYSAAQFKSAVQAKGAGQWRKAYDDARKVLRFDPAHGGAKKLLAEIRAEANNIYIRGYTLKDSDPDQAVELFKMVIEITPRDDETHKKALDRLKQVQ